MITDLGTFVCIDLVDQGGQYQVPALCWDEIDAAFGNWIERRVDRLLRLTAVSGADFLLPASRISDMMMSTPENRRCASEREAALKSESGFSE